MRLGRICPGQSALRIVGRLAKHARPSPFAGNYDLEFGSRFCGLRFDIGKREYFPHRVAKRHRSCGPDNVAVQEHSLAAVPVLDSVWFN